MEFAILGPVEVRRDGIPVPVGGPKQRALLAILLLRSGRPVSRDALIAGIWGDRPPPSANRTLDSSLSKLRRALGPGRIARRPPGYALHVEPGELDADRFDRLIAGARAESDPGVAVGLLQEALELWRGPALADLRDAPFADGDLERLDGRRLDAVEELHDAQLALGRGPELVEDLERDVREHPFSERLVGQLMLALYRADRQADALDACQAARHRFGAELGLELGPRVRELEGRILRHDPTLMPARPSRAGGGRRARLRRIVPAAFTALAAAVIAVVALETAGGGPPSSAAVLEARLVPVDAGSGSAGPAVALPGPPAAIARGARSLWVADPDDQLVARVDPRSHAVIDRIPIAGQPGSIAAGDGAIWVASTLGGTVARIDPTTDRVVRTVTVEGGNTGSIAIAGGTLWVADTIDDSLVALDAHTGARRGTYPLAFRPTSVTADRRAVWVAGYDTGVAAEVDAASGRTIQTIKVGNGPAALAIAGGALWVANSLDSTVSRIAPRTGAVTATIPVASGPAAIAAGSGAVWVASEYAGTLTRIDPRTGIVVRTIRVGGQPATLALAGGRVWAGAAASPRSHRGGTLVIESTQRFATVDPSLHYTAEPFQFGRLAYDGLVTFQASPGPAGLRLVPDLAVALPAPAEAGTVYTFRLRQGIRYSNGRMLRAGDFRRAIERLYRVHSLGASYFGDIIGAPGCARSPSDCRLARGIVTDDADGTVTFRLRHPDPDFPFKLATFSYAAPIPADTPDRDSRGTPVPGTGPYMITGWDGGNVRLVRNPFFHEWSHAAQPAGNPDEIRWRFVGSAQAATDDVAAGRADWLLGLVPIARLHALELARSAQVHRNPSMVFDFAPLNTHRPPFDHLGVRRALNLAIDRASIVRMYGGRDIATPLCQTLVKGMPGYRRYCPYTLHPDATGRWSAPDLATARRLVDASGTKGELVDVWGATDELGVPSRVPAYFAGVLRSLGFRTRLHHMPLGQISEGLRRTFQISVDGDWQADYPAASADIPQFFACGGGYTNGYVCDRTLDREMHRATALALSTPRLAAAEWRAVDRRITDQALWVPTVNVHEPEVTSARVRNYQYNPVWGFIADQVWLR